MMIKLAFLIYNMFVKQKNNFQIYILNIFILNA